MSLNPRQLLVLAVLIAAASTLVASGIAYAAPLGAPSARHDRPQAQVGLSSNERVGGRVHHRHPSKRRSTSTVASSPSTDLLFRGTRISDFQMNQSAPGAVSEVPDPAGSGESVFEMTVKDSDVYPITPTADPRAQLLSPSIIEPGEEFWWSSKFYLPADFPASVPGWLTVLEGPYGPPFNGTPPWHIEVNGTHIQWSRNGSYGWDVPWQMPLVRGAWVSVLLHERFAADGWVEMWVNGEQVTFFTSGAPNPRHEPPTQRLAMATLDQSNDGGPNFAVIQSYRKAGMFDAVSLFQGPMTLGRTRASVGG